MGYMGEDQETEYHSHFIVGNKKCFCIPISESPNHFSEECWRTLGLSRRGQLDGLDLCLAVTDCWSLGLAGNLPGQGE